MRRLIPGLAALLIGSVDPAGAADVPAVAAGPALYEQAAAVETPIDAVVVYSDRARITRQGRAELRPGVRAVRLSDLPGTTMLDTLRVGAKGATVLRVEAAPVERIRAGIDAIDGLVATIEDLRAQIERIEAREAVLAEELGLINIGPAAVPADVAAPPTSPDGWRRTQRFIADRRDGIRAERVQMKAEREALGERLAKAQAELARYDADAFTPVQRVEVLAVLEVERANPVVTVDYFVGGASWKPAYTVELIDEGKAVTLRSAGRVIQTTGEDWADVALSLSTAVPGQGIAAPRLDTWTLGESRDFTPRPRAQRDTAGQPLPRTGPTASPADAVRQARLAALQSRVQQALSYSPPDITVTLSGGTVGLGMSGSGSGGGGYGAGAGAIGRAGAVFKRDRPQAQAPPAPARAEMTFGDAAVEGEMMRPQALSSAPGTFGDPAPVRRTPLDLFDQRLDTRQRFADPQLPAVLAGGLDYVWKAATRATVPSSPETHTVPLSARRYPVDTRYEVAPALRPTAYLAATVRNTRDTPILGGPVDIFVGADYVGTGALATTGPGGELQLPLGADEDIRVERRVLPETRTEGLIGKEDLTAYTTEIDIANDKRRAIAIRVVEQFPLDGLVEDVTVKRGKAEPKPSAVDEAGRITFDLEVPPGQARTVRFRYTIRRPADWQLYQQ